MRQGKLVLVVLLLIVAIVGGAFFAGWLIITLLHVQVPLAWNTWLQYYKAIDLPQVAPYVLKIKIAGGIGFGLPLLIWLILLIPLFQSKQQSLHGDASLAHLGDIKKADLLQQTKQGIVIGEFGGHYLWLNGHSTLS